MRAILCAAWAWAWASWPGRIRELGLGAPPHLMTAYGEPVEPIFTVHFGVRLLLSARENVLVIIERARYDIAIANPGVSCDQSQP